ncbi:unnamed protein product, partial [Oikopleura dioica]
ERQASHYVFLWITKLTGQKDFSTISCCPITDESSVYNNYFTIDRIIHQFCDRCERSWIEKIAAEASDAGSNIITPAMWKKYESEMARNNDATGIIFGIVCGSIILILTLIVLGPWIKGCLCPTLSFRKFYRKAREVKIDKVFPEELFLDQSRITTQRKMAEGAFGTIWKGSFRRSNGLNYEIAIKTIKVDEDTSREKDKELIDLLKREGVKMRGLDHKHVLSLKGIVEIDNNFCLVFKWMEHGSLNLYVKKNRNSLTLELLINFCRDIADGMEYLAGNNLIHRDLAARNCLLDDKMRVKVADFGLSRSHAQGGHFSKRNSILRNLPIPVKWMSPESLKFHFYDERSDVWSFGIVIWEIFSYGAVPFPKAPTEPSIFLQYIEKGNRPKKPQDMPENVHAIMKKCLDEDKWKRKNFNGIKTDFQSLLAEMSPPEGSNSTDGATPIPPVRNISMSSSSASWRPPTRRIDSVVTIGDGDFTEPPPPYSSLHSGYV